MNVEDMIRKSPLSPLNLNVVTEIESSVTTNASLNAHGSVPGSLMSRCLSSAAFAAAAATSSADSITAAHLPGIANAPSASVLSDYVSNVSSPAVDDTKWIQAMQMYFMLQDLNRFPYLNLFNQLQHASLEQQLRQRLLDHNRTSAVVEEQRNTAASLSEKQRSNRTEYSSLLSSATAKPQDSISCLASYRARPVLWKFILHQLLLNNPDSGVEWLNESEGLFRINDTARLSDLWGRQKGRWNRTMNYSTVSRSLRNYYRQNIMRKRQAYKRLEFQFSSDCMSHYRRLKKEVGDNLDLLNFVPNHFDALSSSTSSKSDDTESVESPTSATRSTPDSNASPPAIE